MSKFHALKPPVISIKDYLTRIAKYAQCSGECFVLALVYIDRIIQTNPTFIVNSLNIHRLLITSVMLAAKFFDDQYFNNAYYARVGGVPGHEMNTLEVEFLFMNNFTLFVTADTYRQYFTELLNHARNTNCNCSNRGNATGQQTETTEQEQSTQGAEQAQGDASAAGAGAVAGGATMGTGEQDDVHARMDTRPVQQVHMQHAQMHPTQIQMQHAQMQMQHAQMQMQMPHASMQMQHAPMQHAQMQHIPMQQMQQIQHAQMQMQHGAPMHHIPMQHAPMQHATMQHVPMQHTQMQIQHNQMQHTQMPHAQIHPSQLQHPQMHHHATMQ